MTYLGPAFAARADRAIATANGISSGAPRHARKAGNANSNCKYFVLTRRWREVDSTHRSPEGAQRRISNDPTVIYAVLGGFSLAGSGAASGHVFRTTVGGSAWTDISPTVGALNEPLDVPFNAIAMDGTVTPTTLFVGTDFGVLRSMDAGASWSVLDDLHFPRVEVSDLVFNPVAGVLVAATYGRGVFKFGPPTGPVIARMAARCAPPRMRRGMARVDDWDDDTCSRPLPRYRFPAEMAGHAVWLYFRLPPGLRMVEELLAVDCRT
jgi:hypothetical protein